MNVTGGQNAGQASPSTNNTAANTTTTTTATTPEWGWEAVSLKDLAVKRKVPGFARVVKGSYMTIGASRFSLQKRHHDIFVHSVKVGVKVLGHCLKRVDKPPHRRDQGSRGVMTRVSATDQRLTVPITYQGWFELLSEDGKSARSITGVQELARTFPSRCLVRENIQGYFTAGDGQLTFDKTKVIPAGEELKLVRVEELSFPSPSRQPEMRMKVLYCVDSRGDNVYLSLDQKGGVFSSIAEENDFTEVFTIRNIIRRFRLPLTVKLVYGVRPKVSESKFSGLIRLDWVFMEETVFVCPLEKNHVRLLPVPCDVTLQLVTATNHKELENSDMFQSIQAKCARMVSNYNNTLHLVVTLPDSVLKKTQHRKSTTTTTRRDSVFSRPFHPGTTSGGEDPDSSSSSRRRRTGRSKSREDVLMDEIDDLYSFVRDGGVAPKPRGFQYDSDEESYWEEPAYEPLDDFRARLTAMESGNPVTFPDHYRPADPSQLVQSLGENAGDVVAAPCRPGGTAGYGGRTDLGKVATDEYLGKVATTADDVGKVGTTVDDLGKVVSADDLGKGMSADDLGKGVSADDVGKVATTADDVGKVGTDDDLGKVTTTVDDVGKVTTTVDDVGKVGTTADDLGKVATGDEPFPPAFESNIPPPLPPRPSDLAATSTKPCSQKSSTKVTFIQVNTSRRTSVANSDLGTHHKPTPLSRQEPAPLMTEFRSVQAASHDASDPSVRSDLAGSKPCSQDSAEVTSIRVNASPPTSVANSNPPKPTLSRQVSAPLLAESRSLQVAGHADDKDFVSVGVKQPVLTEDLPKMPVSENTPEILQRRSDSDPSLPVRASSSAITSTAVPRFYPQPPRPTEAKPEWKQRHKPQPNKDRDLSASSGSGQPKGVTPKLTRDFRDSNLSSRTQTASSSSSSGERSARQRMQTLYL
ncbi:hypothetical protein ACOMHN_010420 [Nucella lapillus]